MRLADSSLIHWGDTKL